MNLAYDNQIKEWINDNKDGLLETWIEIAKIPAIPQVFPGDIFGSRMPLAMATEKASIARPTPRPMLSKKNLRSNSIRLPLTAKSMFIVP